MLEVGHLHCCKCTEVNAAKYYSTGNLIHGGEKRRGTRVFEECFYSCFSDLFTHFSE